MGNLAAHVITAIFFLIYGVWWGVATVWVYLSQKFNFKMKQTGFYEENNLIKKSYIPFCIFPKWPIEPVLKIIFPAMGICMEVFFSPVPNEDGSGYHMIATVWSMYDKDGSFTQLVKLHHITMYCCFILSGIVDLVSMRLDYPKSTPQVFLALAFFVEFFTFYYHIKGDTDRSHVEILVHELLLYSIAMCVLFTALRIWKATNILINSGVAIGITLQGTWFIETGVVVFGPIKWLDVHNNYMFIAVCFMWHFMLIVVALFLLLSFMQCGVQRYIRNNQIYELVDVVDEKLVKDTDL